MTLRHRQPDHPGESNQSIQAPSPTSPKSELEWYRHPLNLFLSRTLRFLGRFGFWYHNQKYDYAPKSILYSRTKRIKVRDGYELGLYIYDPEPRSENASPSGSGPASTSPTGSASASTCIVNFHGGGFAIGHPTDDSRWANACTAAGYTFVSVGYRKAPEYPWPTPVEDCVDATRYVLEHFEEFHRGGAGAEVDRGVFAQEGKGQGQGARQRVVLSGFSAGGSLAVTTALALLNPSLSAKPLIQNENEEDDLPNSNSNSRSKSPYQNRILGLVSFYPVLDWYTPRTAKLSPGVVALPRWLTRMFDTSYLPPSLQVGRKHPLISPLHAPPTMLKGLPGVHMVVCGFDSLAQEGKDFADMLGKPELQPQLQGDAGGNRDVVLREVKGAKHGWDKPPLKLPRDVEVEYQAAVESIKRWEAALGK